VRMAVGIRNVVFLILVLTLSVNVSAGFEAGGCEFAQTFENAAAGSQAIFYGKAVEERTVSAESKGGIEIGYKEIKFEVTKSWKLIDKRTVWLRVPAKRNDHCGFESVGREYLVYANQLNDLLYISPMSRTMPSEMAKDDLQRLGSDGLRISEGEFYLFQSDLLIILALAAGGLLVFALAFVIYRRPKF
jgi:hypothetical protein